MISRRGFMKSGTCVAAATFASNWSIAKGDLPKSGKLTFGIITDVHQDVMHDGVERMTKFIADMKQRNVGMIISLGDFCTPKPANDKFLAAWNEFQGAKHHVIGNHETDGGFKREKVVEYLGMPGRYYSFDDHGVHFVVLDGNDPDGKTKGYARSCNAEQLKWLASDLASTKLPTIISIHQPIDGYDKNLANAAQVREVIATANREAGFQKVMAVFSGHAHLDYVKVTDNIPHIQFNSAAYVWVDKKHANYSADLVKAHPHVAATCPYAEPLWAVATIDFEANELKIEGRKSQYVGPDPWQVGLKEDAYQRSRELCRPAISDRSIKLG